MTRQLIPAFAIILFLTSCSSMRPVNSKQPVIAGKGNSANTDKVQFLNDISTESTPPVLKYAAPKTQTSSKASLKEDHGSVTHAAAAVEKASATQLKYAILLDTEVESLDGDLLLDHVDEWYGTRYKLGGNSKAGIDCSAFVQAVYVSAFALTLPRTAREQYKASRIISSTELKEGDLVFFNTRGGVSHVGIYLQNNKFIHASTSQGVTVSDMYDPYYMRRFIGAGRIEKPEASNKIF
ncbi:C40 family peptidase [Terrimonas sp. NA20]|uniref:C40 family peptidase n=1 Tax=Terrimonas ginsenosidimutans TaxID=2908004 RepID=A0ABS9KXX1_9BACT|nr:C40 family peptidase [Terrimonas ginsenosidimutans]MCG2617234.1 C40 family peptidase [Terrimonas ginsenosidimutans]